jgi:signal transduction histidine kinase
VDPGRDTFGSPLPTYGEELVASQLAAIRAACLLSAPLLIGFSLLDHVLALGAWVRLLVVRLVAAALLLFCARAAERQAPPLPLAGAAVALIMGALAAAIDGTGGAGSPYLYSVMIVQAGVTILVPLRTAQALALNLESLAFALAPLALRPLPPALTAIYLATMAVVSVAGAALQDRLRRREHQARAEFARHFGLLNLGTLAGGLAHELSNPLNTLFLQVEMLSKDPHSAVKRMEKLRANLDRMRSILEAMRNGARLSGGERRPVDLAREADLAFTLIEAKLRNKAALVRAYAEVPLVYCEPTLLGQVLVNLLANAADAVAARPNPRIALRVRREGALAIIEVEDNGPGVPDELREKIFQPFFSTKGDLGNGLGLWISSEIVRVHGGSFSVQKGSWGGALFRVALPINARTTLETEQPSQSPQA